MDDSAINTEAAALPPTREPAVRKLHGLRLWFSTYLAWLIVLFALSQATFARYEAGDQSAMALWLLALMGFYLTLCNTLLPLPTSWIFMLLATDDVMLFDSVWLRVAAISVIGATSTMMANLNEYHVFAYFLRARLGYRIRRTNVYKWAARWFDVSPFQTLTLIAFVPIPVDFVRWLAILRRYPRRLYAAAYWIGRLPRYALLAGAAVVLKLNTLEILLLQLVLIAVLGARLAWTALRRKQSPPSPANP